MQILILEDDEKKLSALRQHISVTHLRSQFVIVSNFADYLKELTKSRYDLLIVDLVVPNFKGDVQPLDMTARIIEATRGDYQCPNFRTPGIALTSFIDRAEESIQKLNHHDFTVTTFDEEKNDWKKVLDRKIHNLPWSVQLDFIVVCALEKEAEAFSEAGFAVENSEVISGMNCRLLKVAGRSGAIVVLPRMGLVSCAITTSIAIQVFKPKLVCMSGICGGVPENASIYDIVVAESCHQHDVGKWTQDTFKPEIYSVTIDHQLAQKIRNEIGNSEFLDRIKTGIELLSNEFPVGVNDFRPRISLAPASSGSAVISSEKKVVEIAAPQRKMAIFEMESYALYEAARQSTHQPRFFSAKAVVDDGGANKGDKFHRVGCLLAAKVTAELIGCFDFV
jgi:nucleoside phosphorylase